MRKRVETGIAGIDKMLYGGIPEGNDVVVAGGPGSGKTLFSMEFLYRNAKQGEIGIFISLEEDTSMIIENATNAFTDLSDLKQLIDNKKLVVYGTDKTGMYMQREAQTSSYTFGKFVTAIESLIETYNATRVVIDSVSLIKLLIRDPFEYRTVSMNLVSVLRRFNVTSLLTMEIEAPDREKLVFLPEFFVYDGIFVMYSGEAESGNRVPSIEIVKMRGSAHSYATVPYEITPSGINIMLLNERKL